MQGGNVIGAELSAKSSSRILPQRGIRIRKKVRHAAGIAADLVFPRRCPVCDEPVRPFGALICDSCGEKLAQKALSPKRDALCCRCGKPVYGNRELCRDCEKRARLFTKGCAVYRYRDVSGMLYRLKYEGRAEYADFLGAKMAERLREEWNPAQVDVLAPVPVSRERLWKRGYNQAELLAKTIAEETGISLREDLLIRQNQTTALRNMSAQERRRNLKNAFIVSDIDVESKRIMLVDDIFTTGATIDACARQLLRAGAAEVMFLAAAIGEDSGV